MRDTNLVPRVLWSEIEPGNDVGGTPVIGKARIQIK